MRPSDWSLGVSVQQELFPRASVEVGYYRRAFTMFTTGGTVTDNLLVSPNDVAAFTLTAPSDRACPTAAATRSVRCTTSNPNVFGQVEPPDHADERRG